MQQRRDSRKGRARVVADQRRGWATVSRGALEHDHSRSRCGQLAPVARLRQKRHRLIVSIRKRPDTLDQRVGIAAKLTAKSSSEFPERESHIGR
jgi:hypothetical protein